MGTAGSSAFKGYEGGVIHAPLQDLAQIAQRAESSVYVVQCPIWCSAATACPAQHLLQRLHPQSKVTPGGGVVEAYRDVFGKEPESINLWISVLTTHSNLHYDSKHGLLVVLRGRKHVELFSPDDTMHVAPHPVFDPVRAHHAQ
eukprot:5696479-Amphidinium_carterae.1